MICTKCMAESDNFEFIKKWTIVSGKSKSRVEISLYRCHYCKKTFRVYG